MSEHGTSIATRPETAPAQVQEAEMSGLVRLAIEQKVSVDVLERLVALQERVSDRNARQAMSEAVAGFQAECPSIKKGRTARIATKAGGSYSYTFASLDEIARAIRPLLHRHGLSYTWDSTTDGKSLACTCILRHVEGAEDRATFACPTDTRAEMSGAQATAAALTYASRQSLVQVLGLTVTDDDVDGADPKSAEKITEGQIADLYALADEVKADLPKFLKYMGVGALSDIPASDYSRAVTALERKRSRA
jgi:hypothetical protein